MFLNECGRLNVGARAIASAWTCMRERMYVDGGWMSKEGESWAGHVECRRLLAWDASTRMARLLADHRLPWTEPAFVARTRIRAILSIAGGWTALIQRHAHPGQYHVSPLRTSCCHPQLALGGYATALGLVWLSLWL